MSHPDVSTLADCFEFLPSDFRTARFHFRRSGRCSAYSTHDLCGYSDAEPCVAPTPEASRAHQSDDRDRIEMAWGRMVFCVSCASKVPMKLRVPWSKWDGGRTGMRRESLSASDCQTMTVFPLGVFPERGQTSGWGCRHMTRLCPPRGCRRRRRCRWSCRSRIAQRTGRRNMDGAARKL